MIAASAAGALMLGLSACGGKGDGHLVFMIWDSGQKSGMEAIAEAYMEDHPDVTIEVQASGWDEYWTKLEASAKSNSMPDIFWMHTNINSTTLSAGLSTLNSLSSTNYPVLMAGSLFAMLPMVILYLIFQKQFIEGVAMTGGK